MLTLSKFVCPSTSKSPFISADVAVIIPAFPSLIAVPTSKKLSTSTYPALKPDAVDTPVVLT